MELIATGIIQVGLALLLVDAQPVAPNFIRLGPNSMEMCSVQC
jgi:hypothetical protein